MYARRAARNSASAGSRASSSAAETGDEPPAEVAHVPVPRVHPEQAGLVAELLRVARRATHDLGPVGGQSRDVLGVQVAVGEGVVELRVGEAAGMMRRGQGLEGRLAAGEREQRLPHNGGV
jgi:hypothetical protein